MQWKKVSAYVNTKGLTDVTNCKDVWFVDLGASNHMTQLWSMVNDVKNLEKLGYVETGNDNLHSIAHVGKVLLSM